MFDGLMKPDDDGVDKNCCEYGKPQPDEGQRRVNVSENIGDGAERKTQRPDRKKESYSHG